MMHITMFAFPVFVIILGCWVNLACQQLPSLLRAHYVIIQKIFATVWSSQKFVKRRLAKSHPFTFLKKFLYYHDYVSTYERILVALKNQVLVFWVVPLDKYFSRSTSLFFACLSCWSIIFLLGPHTQTFCDCCAATLLLSCTWHQHHDLP